MAKILIVDDEPLTVQMLTTFLSMSGYESTGALSRSQTWDKLAYEEPDVILLDIMLPDGNGIEICRELRAQEKWKDVPVIMISAHVGGGHGSRSDGLSHQTDQFRKAQRDTGCPEPDLIVLQPVDQVQCGFLGRALLRQHRDQRVLNGTRYSTALFVRNGQQRAIQQLAHEGSIVGFVPGMESRAL